MSDHKRTILTISIIFILSLILLTIALRWENRRNTIVVDDFICTSKSIVYLAPMQTKLSGTFVLNLKSERLAIHYKVEKEGRPNRLFFQDINISKLLSTSPRTFTFKVNSVNKYPADTTEGMFSWLRLLQPGTVNELKLVKIGKNTYMYSLNRRIYNICTTSSGSLGAT